MRHFLQSKEWLGFQEALGNEVVRGEGKGWSFGGMVEKPDGRGGKLHKRLYLPYGPTVASKALLSEALAAAAEAARQKGLVYVRYEPIILSGEKIDLRHYGSQLNIRPMQPDRTLVLDLKQDDQDILSGMSGTNRNLWNTYKNKGLKFRKSYKLSELPTFLKMMTAVSERNKIIVHDDKYFEVLAKSLFPSRHAGLAIAELNGEPIVAAMFYDDLEGDVRYYAHAGSLEEARKVQANSPLLTFMILDAKKSGLKEFDFFGVAPIGDDSHRWAGHSKFKRSFGGVDKEYLGTWELPLKRSIYSMAQLTRKIRR